MNIKSLLSNKMSSFVSSSSAYITRGSSSPSRLIISWASLSIFITLPPSNSTSIYSLDSKSSPIMVVLAGYNHARSGSKKRSKIRSYIIGSMSVIPSRYSNKHPAAEPRPQPTRILFRLAQLHVSYCTSK